jgi:hypothetical protein
MYFKVKKVKNSSHLIEIIPNVCLTKQTEATQPLFANCQLMGFRNCFVRGGLCVNNLPISWVKYIGRHLEFKKCLTASINPLKMVV